MLLHVQVLWHVLVWCLLVSPSYRWTLVVVKVLWVETWCVLCFSFLIIALACYLVSYCYLVRHLMVFSKRGIKLIWQYVCCNNTYCHMMHDGGRGVQERGNPCAIDQLLNSKGCVAEQPTKSSLLCPGKMISFAFSIFTSAGRDRTCYVPEGPLLCAGETHFPV